MREVYKIGEIIRLKEGTELESPFGGDVTKTTKVEKVVAKHNGSLLFLDGGFITPPNDVKVRGYATRDITHNITSRIGRLLTQYEVDEDMLEEIKDEIWDIVEQYLEDIFE